MKNKVVKTIGGIMTLAALLFVMKRLCSYDIDLEFLLSPQKAVCFISLCLAFAIHMFIVGVPWRCMVEYLTKEKVAYSQVALIVCKSNLYKYVPGNIFQYVGRNELAAEENMNHGKIVLSTLLDVLINATAILMFSILLYAKGISIFLENNQFGIRLPGTVGKLVLAFLTVVMLIFILKKFKKCITRESVLKLLFCVFYYFFLGCYTGIMFYIIMTQILTVSIPLSAVSMLIGGYLMGWVIGFVMPGAPGGIGVREVVTVLLLSSAFEPEAVLMGIVIYRFINIIGDLLGFVLAYCVRRVIIRIHQGAW